MPNSFQFDSQFGKDLRTIKMSSMSINETQEEFSLGGGLSENYGVPLDFGIAEFASMPKLTPLPLPHLDLGVPALEIKTKKRRHFGRGVQERRILHKTLNDRLADKSSFSMEEMSAFADLKTFSSWAPVYPQDLITATIPGDWVMFSKPKFHDQPQSERKRIVCKVAGKTENSITFETISASKELEADYSWTYRWDEDADESEIFNTITGFGKRQYYMRIPSTKSVAMRPKKTPGAPRKKLKTAYGVCRHCGKDQNDPVLVNVQPVVEPEQTQTGEETEDGEVTE